MLPTLKEGDMVFFKKYISLTKDGESKVKQGITSDIELKRVLKEVE